MGVGAAIAALAVTNGNGWMRTLAGVTAVLYVVAAATVLAVAMHSRPVTLTISGASEQVGPRRARGLSTLSIANLPFALCFDVLEVALPILLVAQLHVSPAWSSVVFLGNTVIVIVAQLGVVRWLSRFPRRVAFALSGALLALSYVGFLGASAVAGTGGAIVVCVVAVVYTVGEVAYAGTGTALVVAASPPGELGRALARWQLSSGAGRAVAPLALTSLLAVGPAALWLPLAIATGIAATVVVRHGPRDESES